VWVKRGGRRAAQRLSFPPPAFRALCFQPSSPGRRYHSPMSKDVRVELACQEGIQFSRGSTRINTDKSFVLIRANPWPLIFSQLPCSRDEKTGETSGQSLRTAWYGTHLSSFGGIRRAVRDEGYSSRRWPSIGVGELFQTGWSAGGPEAAWQPDGSPAPSARALTDGWKAGEQGRDGKRVRAQLEFRGAQAECGKRWDLLK